MLNTTDEFPNQRIEYRISLSILDTPTLFTIQLSYFRFTRFLGNNQLFLESADVPMIQSMNIIINQPTGHSTSQDAF